MSDTTGASPTYDELVEALVQCDELLAEGMDCGPVIEAIVDRIRSNG